MTNQGLPVVSIRPSLKDVETVMVDGAEVKQEAEQVKPKKDKRPGWLWPLGAIATGLAGAGVLLLRGCWHRRMSWPVEAQGYSYQVCLGCGIKRLFDEKGFYAYGPFRYDLNDLIAWERDKKGETTPRARAHTSSS
jgi:hypothetical protein